MCNLIVTEDPRDGSVGKGVAAESDNLSLVTGTHRSQELTIPNCLLISTCGVWHVHTHIHKIDLQPSLTVEYFPRKSVMNTCKQETFPRTGVDECVLGGGRANCSLFPLCCDQVPLCVSQKLREEGFVWAYSLRRDMFIMAGKAW